MYVPAHFELNDKSALGAFLGANVFATIAAQIEATIHIAYAPMTYDPEPGPHGSMRFHIARANPLAEVADGASLTMSVMGPHAYVSPDWYSTTDQVPTWNYTAVEGSGKVTRLTDSGLVRFLSELAAQEEIHLAPKPAWTMDRVPTPRLNGLLGAIVGFRLVFDRLEGKAKLSQNRSLADRKSAIAALEARGGETNLAVANAMRAALPREGN